MTKKTLKNTKKRFPIFIAIITLIALAAVIFYPKPKPSFSPEIQQKLDTFLTESLAKYKAPGLMVGIWSPEGSWIGTKGTRDIATGEPMDPAYRTRIGSVTKTFTGTVILQLVDEGKIGLDDTLDKYRPYIPNADKITIKQLLNMTSGIYNYLEIDRIGKAIFADRFKEWDPKELVNAAIEEKPYFEPGAGFHYSNTNTVILGMIIEQITGNAVGDEINTRIIKKLGLKDTIFPTTSEIPGNHIHGYSDLENKAELVDWTTQNVSWGWTAGAMISNMYDLKTYAKALTDGTFLSKELQEKRLTEWVDVKKKTFDFVQYGLAVFNAAGFIGHNGELPGYITGAFYNPEKDITIVIISNIYERDRAILEIFEGLVTIVWPDIELK